MKARPGRGASNGRRRAGELEAAVLEVLWAAQQPMGAADVRSALGNELAYSTVLTILARLHRKGMVGRQRQGRAHAYRSLVAEVDVVRDQLRRILHRASSRMVALHGIVASLEPHDTEVLRQILERAPRHRPPDEPPAYAPGDPARRVHREEGDL